MLWIETRTPEETKQLFERMWGLELREKSGGVETYRVRGEGLSENGEFWGDAIRRLKDNAQERLNMAKRHLPLPGAFWQAAIALRDIIRQARKQKTDYLPALEELSGLRQLTAFVLLTRHVLNSRDTM
jgi:hypothetical protein